MFDSLQVTFHLDGAGLYYDPAEPIHLDALLVFACAAHHGSIEPPARDEMPADISIPVKRWHAHGSHVFMASALFPDGQSFESIIHWRKKFRQNRVEMTSGSPNLTNATFREYNMPLPLLHCHRMVAWCVGERREVLRELRRNIRSLGKKRAHGHGVINEITVERVDHDWSLVREGRAQRWLPHPSGTRLVRPRPPYWNNVGKVMCCEVGSLVEA